MVLNDTPVIGAELHRGEWRLLLRSNTVQAVTAVVADVAQNATAKGNVLGSGLDAGVVFCVKLPEAIEKLTTLRFSSPGLEPGQVGSIQGWAVRMS